MKPIRASLTAFLVTASASKREVTGVLVPFGVKGNASIGPIVYEPGSLEVHAERRRVKLLVQHDDERPVGYLTDVQISDTEATGTFHLPAGAAGDVALSEAASGLRDAFSIGTEITEYAWADDGTLLAKAATLREVSLVSVPAYDDARVLDVAASRPTTKGTTMHCQLCGHTHAAGAPCPTTPEPTQAPAQATAAATTPQPAPAPAPAPTAVQPSPSADIVAAANAPMAPARTAGRGPDLATASRIVRDALVAGNVATVQAALGDIVPGDDAAAAIAPERPQWAGELWRASNVRRPIIDAFGTPRPLTGLKIEGFTREYADLIAEYEGDKAAIHGAGTFTTVPASADAQRWAGGNDIDRAFIDLGSAQFLQDWFVAATDEYKQKSEAYAAAIALAAATVVTPAPATVTSALAQLGVRAATLGSNLSFITFAADVWAEFVELPADAVPWWLKAQGAINLGTVSGNAGGLSFDVEPSLPAGAILAGDSRAATWYEVNPPVRVQALNIPNGGVDVGVFGYGGMIVNDARALFRANVTPAIEG